MKRIVLAVTLMWPMAGTASHFFDNHELLKRCDQTVPWELRASPFDYGNCLGYVTGIIGAIGNNRPRDLDLPKFCLPASVNGEQLRQAWLRYVKAQTARRHLLANVSVVAALARAWPCDR